MSEHVNEQSSSSHCAVPDTTGQTGQCRRVWRFELGIRRPAAARLIQTCIVAAGMRILGDRTRKTMASERSRISVKSADDQYPAAAVADRRPPPDRRPTPLSQTGPQCFFVRRLRRKSKASRYSITERRLPELIPVLGSQPAGDVSHKPGGRLPSLSTRPAVTPATLKKAGTTSFAAW